MKKTFLILSMIFAAASVLGVIYVILHRGEANAGYAVIPMVFCLAFLTAFRAKK